MSVFSQMFLSNSDNHPHPISHTVLPPHCPMHHSCAICSPHSAEHRVWGGGGSGKCREVGKIKGEGLENVQRDVPNVMPMQECNSALSVIAGTMTQCIAASPTTD